MSDCDPAEIAAYEVVRQRLRTLAIAHPWMLEITPALKGRMCRACGKKRCIEHPADHYRCTACGYTWETAPVVGWGRRR